MEILKVWLYIRTQGWSLAFQDSLNDVFKIFWKVPILEILPAWHALTTHSMTPLGLEFLLGCCTTFVHVAVFMNHSRSQPLFLCVWRLLSRTILVKHGHLSSWITSYQWFFILELKSLSFNDVNANIFKEKSISMLICCLFVFAVCYHGQCLSISFEQWTAHT